MANHFSDQNHIFTSILLFLIILCPITSHSQQPYIREYGTDCDEHPKNTSALGYLCNGVNSSCLTFITFRSEPPYTTVESIAGLLSSDATLLAEANSVAENATFKAKSLVIVPVKCSCGTSGGEFYQYDASYVAKSDDNYYTLANVTFQGLTTCQAIDNQTGNAPMLGLEGGDRVTIPLRCACPTKDQLDIGIKYLLSYLTDEDDDDSKISDAFGVDNALFLKANRLSERDLTIYPVTTVLVPLKSLPPNSSLTSNPPPSPPPPPQAVTALPPSTSSSKTRVYALVGAIGGSIFVLFLTCVAFVFFYWSRKRKAPEEEKLAKSEEEKLAKSEEEKLAKSAPPQETSAEHVLKQVIVSDIAAESLRVYNIEELRLVTGGFGPASLIGGSVHRGSVDGGTRPVAIKRMEGEVTTEIKLLQKVNHFNVVALAGVCYDQGRWLLVYDYAANGSLSDWIFETDTKKHFLTWTQRVQIALDIATGLSYLHNFANPSHVHKDVKSSNVLLDSDFRAKIASFGLARSMEAQQGEFSVTNHIVGTIGYLGPEYLENGLVSTKLDVYAFGVVLLEMVTGKEVSVLYEENRSLSDVFSGDEKREVCDFVDVSLRDKCPDEIVGFVIKVIDGCLKKNPEARPTMDEIVQILSKALSYSLTWELSNGLDDIAKCFDAKL